MLVLGLTSQSGASMTKKKSFHRLSPDHPREDPQERRVRVVVVRRLRKVLPPRREHEEPQVPAPRRNVRRHFSERLSVF